MVQVRQPVVIKAKLMEQSGVEIVHADAAFDGSVSHFVGSAVNVAGFEAAASQDQTKRVTIVISARVVLGHGQAAEFPRPQDDRRFQ